MEQWSAEGLCSNPMALVHVIDQMGVAQRRTGNKPIVVHGRLVKYTSPQSCILSVYLAMHPKCVILHVMHFSLAYII